jgi:transcriptional regulator with XRE-family HTH domain
MGKNKIHSKVVFSVAQKIRRHREALKFSQEEFADHIQLDRSNYGAIERGERNITIFTLARIANGLAVEVGILFPNLNELSKLL